MEYFLPRKTKEGKPRVSYSQISLFNSKKSFSLGIEGVMEYILVYFLDHQVTAKFGGNAWGQFGKDVESYIGERLAAETFTEEEKAVLDKIEPLGVLSSRFEIDLGGFSLTGILDDRKEGWDRIRDYKTASKATMRQYERTSYVQLDLYALAARQKTGNIPSLEVCVIERKGNANKGGGRGVLEVAGKVWYIEKTTTKDRLDELQAEIVETAKEISEYYRIFLELNKIQ